MLNHLDHLGEDNVKGFDLIDLLIDERHDTARGHTVALEVARAVSPNALKELLRDDNDLIFLQLVCGELWLPNSIRPVCIVLRGPDGDLAGQQRIQLNERSMCSLDV